MSHAKRTLTRNTALNPEPVKPEITLGDEEVSDVSLATFRVFDKENAADGQRFPEKPRRWLRLRPRLRRLNSADRRQHRLSLSASFGPLRTARAVSQ